MVTNLEFELVLEPIGYGQHWPEIYVKIDGDLLLQQVITEPKTLGFDIDLQDGSHDIALGLVNKNDADTVVNGDTIVADKAIFLRSVGIETYHFDDFLHRATYYPIGREPLKSNYLGWNGEWRLPIETPIFTWLHQTQHLGWIYGKNV